jgi:hypothetical protein
MLIMDSVYRNQLLSLGFDPETFPIIYNSSAIGWGSTGQFSSSFAQAPIGLWDNYRGFSNVGYVPSASTVDIGNSQVNIDTIQTTETSISSTEKDLTVNVSQSTTNLQASATDINVSAGSFDTYMASDPSSSVALASSQYSTSVSSDASLDIDVKVVSTGLTKGFDVSLASVQSKEYTVSVV